MITSAETEETLTKGFEMLKRTLPNDAFFNTIDGPLIFMTDNCDELWASIKKVWSKATLLLCNFHILQQVWRYNKYGAGFMRKSMEFPKTIELLQWNF